MTDQQINDLVAERVMGWQKSDNLFMWCKDRVCVRDRLYADPESDPFSPSTDMNDAMEAIRAVPAEHDEAFWREMKQAVPFVRVGFRTNEDLSDTFVGWPNALAYLTPKDICLAMLRAVGVEVEA